MPRPLHFPPRAGIPNKQFPALFLTGKDANAVSERFYPINGDIGELSRLKGGMQGKDAGFHAPGTGHVDDRERSRDVTYRSIEAQLPHHEICPEVGKDALPGSGDDAQRDGQVIAASALVQVRGREIDDYLAPWNPVLFDRPIFSILKS